MIGTARKINNSIYHTHKHAHKHTHNTFTHFVRQSLVRFRLIVVGHYSFHCSRITFIFETFTFSKFTIHFLFRTIKSALTLLIVRESGDSAMIPYRGGPRASLKVWEVLRVKRNWCRSLVAIIDYNCSLLDQFYDLLPLLRTER